MFAQYNGACACVASNVESLVRGGCSRICEQPTRWWRARMDQVAQKQRYRARVAQLVDKACQVIRCRLDEFRAQCKPEYVCPVKQPPPSVHYPAVRCRRTIVVAKVRVWVRLVIRQWRQATAQCQLEKREERLQHKSARKVRAVSRWFARRPHSSATCRYKALCGETTPVLQGKRC